MGGRFNRENWREYIRRFNENDEETTVQAVPNEKAEEWVEREVPFFDCPDPVLEETWYFRWWVFRKHIKDTGRGRIITEFLPRVPWAGPYNSINGANGHHIAEARWLKQDRSLVREYLAFWLRGEGQETSYSSWLADTVYEITIQIRYDTVCCTFYYYRHTYQWAKCIINGSFQSFLLLRGCGHRSYCIVCRIHRSTGTKSCCQ